MGASFDTSSGSRRDGGWKPPLVAALRRMAAGDLSGALPHLEQAHRLGPDVPEVCLAYGRELARAGNRLGLDLLERAYRADRTLLSAGAELARQLAAIGELDRARSIADELVCDHPDDALARICRGEIAVDDRRLADAEADATRALNLANDDDKGTRAARALLARCHNQRGIERAESDDFESALFAFRRAADLDPEWSAPLTNMGAAFSRIGKHRRALDLYRQAADVEPDNPLPSFNIGLELIELGEWTTARSRLEHTVGALLASDRRSSSLLAQAHCALARVYRQLGADARAVRALEYASHLVGAGAEIWAELARAHIRCGELSKARRAARIALALAPDSDHVRQAWSEFAGLRARMRARRRNAR
ncbi:MAG: tetratricopeptide repeat protein [Deltaproteobacteria bacterium]|nr:tetratricopeptide repeat protein [Deltaproteobacteria bacterium]